MWQKKLNRRRFIETVAMLGAAAFLPLPWPSAAGAVNFQVGEQMLEHRAVVGLACAHEHHQGPSSAVDEMVDLAGQPAAGEQLSIPVDRGVSGDLRFGVLIAV